MLDPGTLIAGRYAIQSPLASGGSGLVYSATDRTTEKRVAIKILGTHVLHERAAREKLRLEAIVAGRVESENVVQVSDAGVDAATGYPFLVMELLKGSDLQHWVEQRGPLDAATAFEFLRQVASGLDKSHTWKDDEQRTVPIVHRDLKPENLFLTHREDGTPLVKILDFGLAKVLSGSATMSSEVRGTPLYMAPEQLSQRPVTPATDIWALGLIAFFLLTGKCYWKSGQDSNAILPAVLKEVADGPTAAPKERLAQFGCELELSQAFDEWFLRCVNLDPSTRFQSAGEAIRALGLALGLPQRSSPLASSAALSAPRRELMGERDSAPSISRSGVALARTDRHLPLPARHAGALPRQAYWFLALLVFGGLIAALARPRTEATRAVVSTLANRTEPASSSARVATGNEPHVAVLPPRASLETTPTRPPKPAAADDGLPSNGPDGLSKAAGAKSAQTRAPRPIDASARVLTPTPSMQPPRAAASTIAPAGDAPELPRPARDPANHR